MAITLDEFSKFRIALARVNEAAGNEFRDYFLKRPGGLANATANEVAEYVYLLVTKYGEASSELACQMYEMIAELEGVTIPAAIPAATPTKKEVYSAINGTMNKSVNVDYVSAAVERLVKQVGQDTTLQNAIRDRAEFAWVPAGDTCAFCLALASRGWQEATRAALKGGHAEHIHGNCDCAYSIRFKQSTTVPGYDPDKYLDIYNSNGGSPQDKINAMRRAAYAQNKEKINAQKRAAYAARNNQKVITKSITIEDVINANKGGEIKSEVITSISKYLSDNKALYEFDSVTLKSLGDEIVFNTEYQPNGTWYNTELQINTDLLGGKNLKQINKRISKANNTVCNNLEDALEHEIYHAKMANKNTKSVIDNLNSEKGILEISKTAGKDKLETISEIGVLKKQGKYDTISKEAKELFEKYFQGEK